MDGIKCYQNIPSFNLFNLKKHLFIWWIWPSKSYYSLW